MNVQKRKTKIDKEYVSKGKVFNFQFLSCDSAWAINIGDKTQKVILETQKSHCEE